MMVSSVRVLVPCDGVLRRCLSLLASASLVLLVQAASAQTKCPPDYEHNVARWKEIVPDKNPPKSYPAGSNVPFWDLSWKVRLENGQVLAEANSKEAKQHVVRPSFNPHWRGTEESDDWVAIPVEGGWLVAFDVGEFGADVIWYSHDGSRQYEVAREYVDQFLLTPIGIFGQGGLAHMGSAFGGLYRFEQNNGKWQLSHLLDTPPYIPIAWLSNKTVLVAMSELRFYSTTNGLQKFAAKALPTNIGVQINDAKLYSNGRWAFTTDKLYLASSSYVTEVDLHTLKRRFLVPDDRFVNDRLKWDVSVDAEESSKDTSRY